MGSLNFELAGENGLYKHPRFPRLVVVSTADLWKHLYRQSQVLMLSHVLKCVFPLGKTQL